MRINDGDPTYDIHLFLSAVTMAGEVQMELASTGGSSEIQKCLDECNHRESVFSTMRPAWRSASVVPINSMD
jgi:hypothetical protein